MFGIGPSDDEDEVAIAMATSGSSAVRLTSFLKRASQVCSDVTHDHVTFR